MKTAIISVTMKGARLGQRVKHSIAPDAICFEKEGKTSGHEDITFSSMKDIIGDVFKTYDRTLYYGRRHCGASDCALYCP